ncbi:MAG: 16S rRNA (cytosine(1402)-N(4))-methyltransferase RsmH [Burkholderiales bacterium]|nr:16S rRNA (cytosine(1402)-N(4))-methyltransferase RsmH [Burkholderiales bacterium]
MTVAVAHRPVLGSEAVNALAVKPEGAYVDATFGRGGHSREILARLSPEGRVVALDRDPEAVASARRIGDARLTVRHARFSKLIEEVHAAGVKTADGVLFDLGVSSPQFDSPERGFSFRHDAPLDMRMDPGAGESAADWLAHAEEAEIREVVKAYGEERFAGAVAKAIVAAREREPVRTTGQLAAIVGAVVRTRERGQNPATRTFQALRLYVNQELEELQVALPQALALLAAGGRLVVVSFHSLEDRIVKNFMRDRAHPEARTPRDLPLRAAELPKPELRLVGKPVRPGTAEVDANPRARSAIMRVAEKVA